MDKPDAVSIVYIAAPAATVWAALTDPDVTAAYFFGHRVEVGAPGGPFVVRKPGGEVDVEGEVLALEPPHRLLVTWKVVWLADLPAARVEYRIDDLGQAVRLTVSEFHGAPVEEKYRESGRQGWALILSGLKTLLETGQPMPPIQPSPPG